MCGTGIKTRGVEVMRGRKSSRANYEKSHDDLYDFCLVSYGRF